MVPTAAMSRFREQGDPLVTHNLAQFRLVDNDCAIKELVFCRTFGRVNMRFISQILLKYSGLQEVMNSFLYLY